MKDDRVDEDGVAFSRVTTVRRHGFLYREFSLEYPDAQ